MRPESLAIGVYTRDLDDYYYGGMFNGIRQVTRAAGVPLLVIKGELPESRLYALEAAHVAGWLVLHPLDEDSIHLAALAARGVPVVTVATAPDELVCTSVVADNRGETRALVGHLVEHGHRRIAYIDHGPYSWNRERYQGYLEALSAAGIDHDPSLVLDTAAVRIEGPQPLRLRVCGEEAARQLIARGMPCTALVGGTDQSAICAMQALQAAGYRVPEDVAVVGFDDIAEAQYAQPPLTTVRTRFDQFGRIAAEELLAMVRGERSTEPRRIYAPPNLLRRRSCGCASVAEIRAQSSAAVAAAPDWQAALAQQLVALVSYPLAPAPGTPPTQIWQAVTSLIAAVEAALRGQMSAMGPHEMERAWQQAVAISENQELLNAAVALLEDAAELRLATAPPAARPQSIALFRDLRVTMLHARLAHESRWKDHLSRAGITNQSISTALLSSQVGESQSLAWLRHTHAIWGCLGLWQDPPASGQAALTVAGVFQPEHAPAIAVGDRYSLAAFPPFAALPPAAHQGQAVTILCPLRAGADDLGVLALCGFADQDFSLPAGTLTNLAALLAATLKRDAQTLALAQALGAAEAANAAKSAFLANMSHELRSPLNAIINFTKFLSKERYGVLSPRQQELQSRVLANAEHLLGLINDVLDLSKIGAGHMELFPEDTALHPVLEGALATAMGFTKDKRLELKLAVPTDLPLVRIDKTRVRQVLLNLLSNAAKFTERGAITLRASVAGGMARIDVVDTGIGIAPEHQALVFEEFRQVEDDFTRRYQGTGLGLPICRRLVELHGGRIWLESAPGAGSTFSFTVPLAATGEPGGAPGEPQGAAQPGAAPPRGERVIAVIDDDPDAQRIVQEQLAGLNCRIRPILASNQALATLRQLRPDLIILDMQMPAPSGWDLLPQLRASPELADTPVVVYSVIDRLAQQLVVTATDYLVKPVDEQLLVHTVRRWLDHAATVLIVDDDADARHVARNALADSYQVIEAANGAQGIELLQQARPQLVVLDLMMPELDGFAVLERIRQDASLAATPVIILSAKELAPHERQWLAERSHLFIPKGALSIDSLATTVGHLLPQHHVPADLP